MATLCVHRGLNRACTDISPRLNSAGQFTVGNRVLSRAVQKLAAGASCAAVLLAGATPARASVLFEDDFNLGFPGWTAVQPPGLYVSGPLLWQYDIGNSAFTENSNIYTDDSTFSPSAIAPMLINDAVTATNFTFTARLTAGDDDGFGLIFGYTAETDFYRVMFARQNRTAGFPYGGWSVDRKDEGITTVLFGNGAPGYVQTFLNTASRPFDVTITVDTQSRLTLTVVDNPLVAPTTYVLVTNQPLPAAANGKVGITTWGMSQSPYAFRIQNLNLTPVALAGNPNALTNWTPVVPPRSSGSTTLSQGIAAPLWSMSVNAAAQRERCRNRVIL